MNQLSKFSTSSGSLNYLEVTQRLGEVDPIRFNSDVNVDLAGMGRGGGKGAGDESRFSATKVVCISAIKHYLGLGIICKADETSKLVDLSPIASYIYQISSMVDRKVYICVCLYCSVFMCVYCV